jgi:hypothetical protein
MDAVATLLTDTANYAIVQLPGRKFPGVVFQGDSLHALIAQVRNTIDLADKYPDQDLDAELKDILELLLAVENKLKSVCDREGISMPYPAT